MSFDEYSDRVRPLARYIVNRVAAPAVGGWDRALRNYHWGGCDWRIGWEIRVQFEHGLSGPINDHQFARVVNDIQSWGRMKGFTEDEALGLHESVLNLRSWCHPGFAVDGWENLFAKRIAATSKVYAMSHTRFWTIYDSRIAYTLQSYVRRFLETPRARGFDDSIVKFPMPISRGNRAPVDGFVKLSTERQARLSFLYASWLLRTIADILNHSSDENPPPPQFVMHGVPDDIPTLSLAEWSRAYVEMALFSLSENE